MGFVGQEIGKAGGGDEFGYDEVGQRHQQESANSHGQAHAQLHSPADDAERRQNQASQGQPVERDLTWLALAAAHLVPHLTQVASGQPDGPQADED